MRIVTLDHRDTGWRVGYRWADDPLAPARLLLDNADVALERLRQMLERDFFGEAMRPAVYQIVALVQDDSALEAVRSTFNGLDMVGVPRNEHTMAVLRELMPDGAFDPVLALTYWQTEPPNFAALFDQFDSGFVAPFAEYAADPAQMRADFASIRASISSAVIGQSARALREVCAQLTGSELRAPIVPSQAVIQADLFCGLPLNVIDWRAPNTASTLNAIPFRILAVASDPGPGANEWSALQGAERAVIALVNTHFASEDYAAMKAYVQAQASVNQVIDADEVVLAGRRALGAIIRSRLTMWLETHFAPTGSPDHVADARKQAQSLIERATRPR